MEVKKIFRWSIFIYLLVKNSYSVTVKSNEKETLQSDSPEKFVNEAEKALNEVKHIRDMTDKMNKYLSSNNVDPKLWCVDAVQSCLSMTERYFERCKRGDCFTLDNVVLYSVPGKMTLQLPHLGQFEAAKYVFKKSGAELGGWGNFTNAFKKKENRQKNTMDDFTNELMKRNLSLMEFNDTHNYLALNEAFYSATIFYQRYLNKYRQHTNVLVVSNFLRSYFKLRHRKLINRLVSDVIQEKTVGISHSDLKSMVDSYILYLIVTNYRPRGRFAVTFANLVKHAIAKSMGYRKVGFLMADYLLRYPVNPNDYCSADAEVNCKEKVGHFLERCDEGDCTTFSRVDLLDPKDWLNVKLPTLPEVNLSLDLFKGSEAKRPNWLHALFTGRLKRMTVPEFKKLLVDRNSSNTAYKTQNQGNLQKFLYKASVEFVFRAKSAITGQNLRDSTKTMMNFATDLLGRKNLYIELPRVRNVMMVYRNYLYRSGLKVELSKVNKFTSDVQHVLFSFLNDPHKGEYNDKYKDEWEKLKKEELEKADQQLNVNRNEKETKSESKRRNGIHNLFGILGGPGVEEGSEEKGEGNLVDNLKDEFNKQISGVVDNVRESIGV